MKNRTIGLIAGLALAVSLAVTAYGAVSNDSGSTPEGADPAGNARLTTAADTGGTEEGALYRAFTYVCPFH